MHSRRKLPSSLRFSVVDQAMEVIEDYQSKILKLEQAVLLKPSMKHVRRRKWIAYVTSSKLSIHHVF